VVEVVEVSARKGVPTVVFELSRPGASKKRGRIQFSCPASEWPTLLLDGVPHDLRSNG
jgi:hypothetical protein